MLYIIGLFWCIEMNLYKKKNYLYMIYLFKNEKYVKLNEKKSKVKVEIKEYLSLMNIINL